MKKLFIATISLIVLAIATTAMSARTTRDLVFDEPEEAASAKKEEVSGGQTIGIKTTVVLNREGKNSTVLPSHEFKSGDSIKLVFTPNIDGYVYWLAKGSSGTHTVLFPHIKAGVDHAVKKNQEYTIPGNGVWKFDDKVGDEELLCILSPTRIEDIEKIIIENATEKLGESAGNLLAALESNNSSKRKTRDLVFDDEDSEDVNTKKQTAEKGTPFVSHYVLSHK